jgi:very-short-patch-repair endonuclease
MSVNEVTQKPLFNDGKLEKVGNYRTCLERQMYGYLTDMGLVSGEDYYEQYPVGDYLLDFAFIQSRSPFRGLDIETDGFMWHSTGKQRQKDGYRTYRLIKLGWQIERFSESFTKDHVQTILEKHNIL